MNFYSEITLPESKQVCRVNQITFSDYYTFNKFLQNGINAHIEDAFFTMLAKYTNNSKYTSLDALTTLLFMRIISIGSQLKFKSGKDIIEIDLVPLLQSLLNINLLKAEISLGDVKIKIQSPTKLCDINSEDYLYSFSVNSDEAILSTDNKQQLYNILPATCLRTISEYSESLETILNGIKFKILDETITSSIDNESLFELLKILFKDSLIACQRKMIAITNYTELDTTYINSLPPAEVEMLINFIEEQEARERKNSESTGPRIG